MLCAEVCVFFRYGDDLPDIVTPLIGRRHSDEKPPLMQNLSTDDFENVLELIVAFEWLVEMSQSVAIALFLRRSFTVAPTITKLNTNINRLMEEVVQGLHTKGVDNAIIARAKLETKLVIVLWSLGSAEYLVYEDRLTSALQLSSLALTSYGGSSAGFQGKVGLKANIEDVRAHPHPTMVVEAYKLAANAFAEEIQNSLPVADTKRTAGPPNYPCHVSENGHCCCGLASPFQLEVFRTIPEDVIFRKCICTYGVHIIAYLVAGDLIGLLLTKIALNKIGTVAISSTVTYKAVGALALIYSDLVLLGSANAETGVTISVHRHDTSREVKHALFMDLNRP
ncbi:hypothetical protein PCH_Pc21g21310 [Penicillium rubens Wisconsin 54-1255]|uniref:Uncharacterized protein n=1 Tax=Penicillium rubens (strain ATCC 28089 / DSM 1075 / NRRL 1951 / Wisconsin 54-1255) TaxID=500485 RepID=B6HLT4_PENRW|nr:hypothetical protein PCH_Pc21g21310 [Penicillium rubens Wisconsin 54-1255]